MATRTGIRATARVLPIRHDGSLPELAQAASIALIVMSKTGQYDWAGVVASAEQQRKVIMTAEQRNLLVRYRAILPYLRRKASRSADGGSVTVAVCDRCGRFVFTIGAVGKKCPLTSACSGTMWRAPASQPRLPKPSDVESSVDGA